jgi:hypothetical protein
MSGAIPPFHLYGVLERFWVSGGLKVKVKIKFTLEQAMKAQRRSRDIALLFL